MNYTSSQRSYLFIYSVVRSSMINWNVNLVLRAHCPSSQLHSSFDSEWNFNGDFDPNTWCALAFSAINLILPVVSVACTSANETNKNIQHLRKRQLISISCYVYYSLYHPRFHALFSLFSSNLHVALCLVSRFDNCKTQCVRVYKSAQFISRAINKIENAT